MIVSPRLKGPRSASLSRANCRALGVLLICGGYSQYSTSGISTIATSPGSSIASAHMPQLIEICAPVASATSLTISGLGAVAVMNIAEVIGLAW